MKKSDYKALSLAQLQERLVELKRELINLRFQLKLGSLKNTSRINVVKKTIARVLTEINFKDSQEVK